MLTNNKMIPGRFLKLQQARNRYAFIESNFAAGRFILVSTHLRSTTYRSLDQFRLRGSSVYMRRGSSWDCIDFSRISAF
jgi:hypothetical protein